MFVCLCNCCSLRQSCFVTLIPTRGRVSWKPPTPPHHHHHQVALWQLFSFLLPVAFILYSLLSYFQMRWSWLNIALILYIYIFFFSFLFVAFGLCLVSLLALFWLTRSDSARTMDAKFISKAWRVDSPLKRFETLSLAFIFSRCKHYVESETACVRTDMRLSVGSALGAIAIKWKVWLCF